MSDSLHLGSFSVGEKIGEGGMGTVYRGQHIPTEVDVAIKVVRRGVDLADRQRFHEEVRAHAGLMHPGIVYLFEYGEIGDAAASPLGEAFHEDHPFIAMELAEHGTVRDCAPVFNWNVVYRILVQTLDALAYAHARKIVHRDLKPANLLRFETAGSEWRIKLADFGTVHAFHRERDSDTDHLETAVGTPEYMAPEQLRGRWREYGPWTDLYALGCIAWELVSGRPPFSEDHFLATAYSHEREERPPLEPLFPVPDELESWIHRAMAIEPSRRFQRAADAMWALPRKAPDAQSASDVERSGERSYVFSEESDESAETGAESVPSSPVATTVTVEEGVMEGWADSGEDSQRTTPERVLAQCQPPLPEDWRPEQTNPLPAPLVGAGLGLFGLREPPFVDRRDECDVIWRELREVVEHQTHRTVFVTGEAGTGKSRLAEWMATRAHEVGAARVLRVTHIEGAGRNEGLRTALERTLRTVKMNRGKIFDHLRETLPGLQDRDDVWRERDARALTEYLRPTADAEDSIDGPRYRFSSAEQKRGLIVRTLRRLSNERPVLLWLDDLQWNAEAIGVLEHLVEGSETPPSCLVVATVRSDVLRERKWIGERLDTLQSTARSATLPLEPLSGEDQRTLLEGLVPLEENLAEKLTERTEGHPLFAMQLLTHWVETGDLQIGDEGFRVPEGREAQLPWDIHDLWMERLDRLVEPFPAADRAAVLEALERAAALGRKVDGGEWREVCREIADLSPDTIRNALIDRGLAEPTDRGWALTHGMLVDSLERRAAEGGRRRKHHRRCAEMLERAYPNQPQRTAARRAEHWLEAGELEEALEPMLQEANRHFESGEYEAMRRVLERRSELLDDLDIPDTDPRSIKNEIELAALARRRGAAPDSIVVRFRELRERAESSGSGELVAQAWTQISRCLHDSGRGQDAAAAAREASRSAKTSGATKQWADALLHRGWVAFTLGNLDQAERHFSLARSRAAEADDPYRVVHSKQYLARTRMVHGDEARASALFEETLKEAREAGNRTAEAKCLNGLGELARFDGDAATARRHYRREAELHRELNQRSEVALSELNLAQADLLAGRIDEAAAQVADARRQFKELSRLESFVHLLRAAELTCAAGAGEWSTFDELLSRYSDGWPEEAPVRKDHPWLLEMAGDYAAEADEFERARTAWRLARGLWSELDDEEAVEHLGEKLGR